MAVITPDSDVILLKVPLEIDDLNQLTFANATAQYNYFYGLNGKRIYDKFTYQRKDGVIRIPDKMDDIISYNYVMYRNEGYSNKWFYAYITGMEFVNDSVTAVSIKTDCFQTWQFDLHYKRCFVEREHVNDDTVGLHTIPEDLNIGDYVLNGTVVNCDLNNISSSENNGMMIVFQVSDFPDGAGALSPDPGDDVDPSLCGGVFNGLAYLICAGSGYHDALGYARKLIKCYDLAGKRDAIVSIFLAPKGMYNGVGSSIVYTNATAGTMLISTLKKPTTSAPLADGVPISIDTITITKPTTLDGYTPVNNKMKCWPFSYFYMSNNSGIDVDFRWEDFNGNPSYNVEGVLTQGCSIKAYPTNYKRGTNLDGYNYGITAGKLPICSWVSDYYTNWCTQQAVNNQVTIGAAATGLLLGGASAIVSGNPLGLVGAGINAATQIAGVMARNETAKITPDQAKGNINSGDLNVAETRFGYTLYPMSCKAEYASICDQFMSCYGYKVNTVKLPNVTGRTNWNYVKTIGCYIDANIPQEDLQTIKNMFDKGVTFWHNPTTFGDYSQSNAIVTP